jgi:hypothetical protein
MTSNLGKNSVHNASMHSTRAWRAASGDPTDLERADPERLLHHRVLPRLHAQQSRRQVCGMGGGH